MTPALPGSLPGLLRVGSPVKPIRRGLSCKFDVSGVVFGFDGDTCGVIDADGEVDSVALDAVSLDLTTPTGRIHALWWVESKEPVSCESIGLRPDSVRYILGRIRAAKEINIGQMNAFIRYCEAHASAPDV